MSSPRKLLHLTDMNIKDFFTDEEWDAIYSAMADYQDHGERETEIAYQIQAKITHLYNELM